MVDPAAFVVVMMSVGELLVVAWPAPPTTTAEPAEEVILALDVPVVDALAEGTAEVIVLVEVTCDTTELDAGACCEDDAAPD